MGRVHEGYEEDDAVDFLKKKIIACEQNTHLQAVVESYRVPITS